MPYNTVPGSVSMWVPGPGEPTPPIAVPPAPVDPGYGQGHPVPPVAAPPIATPPVQPMPPIATVPGLPEVPTQPLPPDKPPSTPPGSSKPPGVGTLPPDPSSPAPVGPPHPPGIWITIDAGKGQPPAWAYIPQDSGLGGTPPPTVGGGPAPTPPPTVTPSAGTPAGHWVPLGKAKSASDPVWAWVPEIGPDYGVKQPQPGPK